MSIPLDGQKAKQTVGRIYRARPAIPQAGLVCFELEYAPKTLYRQNDQSLWVDAIMQPGGIGPPRLLHY